jgi:hypothetical protein
MIILNNSNDLASKFKHKKRIAGRIQYVFPTDYFRKGHSFKNIINRIVMELVL